MKDYVVLCEFRQGLKAGASMTQSPPGPSIMIMNNQDETGGWQVPDITMARGQISVLVCFVGLRVCCRFLHRRTSDRQGKFFFFFFFLNFKLELKRSFLAMWMGDYECQLHFF
jgi:hypothetical protein